MTCIQNYEELLKLNSQNSTVRQQTKLKMGKTWEPYQKKTCRWQMSIQKDTQYHMLLENCKLKQ